MSSQSENNKELSIFNTQNVYLTAFLISHPEFKLGKVEAKDLTKSNIIDLEVLYDSKYENMLNNFIDLFNKEKAIVCLNVYQKNIRFVMHLVNKRKSGIKDETNG